MTRDELFRLMTQLAIKQEEAADTYIRYCKLLREAGQLTERLKSGIEEELSRPRIEIADFEIDG